MVSTKTVIALCGTAFLLGTFATSPSQEQPKKPQTAQKKSQWVYELRTYTTPAGKLNDLHKRFADHTIKLFEKHGMKNVAYWTVTNDNKFEDKNNTLVYLLAHKSRDAAKESWKKFMDDPDWKKAWAESKKDGPLVTKVKSLFLKQTEYSPDPFRAVRTRRKQQQK